LVGSPGLVILADRTARRPSPFLNFLLRQTKREATRFALPHFEDGQAAVVESRGQQEVGRIIAQQDIVGELHNGQPYIKLLPACNLAFPDQRVIGSDVDRLTVPANPQVAKIPDLFCRDRKTARLSEPTFLDTHIRVPRSFEQPILRPLYHRLRHRSSKRRCASLDNLWRDWYQNFSTQEQNTPGGYPWKS
jgi:hypothetical protein